MARRPDRRPNWPPDQPRGHDPPPDAAADRSRQSGGSGNLPPPSALGFGPEPKPGFERDWQPPIEELEATANLPDRPPSRISRGVAVLVPVIVGLLLTAVAVGLLWFDVVGGPDRPEPTAGALGAMTPGIASPVAATPIASPLPSPALALVQTPTSGAIAPTSTATAQAAETPTAPSLVIAAGPGTVGGIDARAVAEAIQEALGSHLPDRAIEVVSVDRLADAAVVVDVAPLPAGFEERVVAVAPLALVTSPRLPLFGVGADQAERLLRGELTNWRAAGAGIRLAVEPLALKGFEAVGAVPVVTYDDYEALVAGLDDHPGGVALAPVELVDFRVNVLAIDGVDPLQGEGDQSRYPYASRLVVGVRADVVDALMPAVDTALAAFGPARSAPAVTRIGVVGDIVPGRSPHQRFGAPDDLGHVFTKVATLLAGYDLTVANLEGVLSVSIQPPDAGADTVFLGHPRFAQGLRAAGVDVVTLANDRVMAFGADGLTDTITALGDAGVAHVGAGANLAEARAPRVFEVNGLKVAVLGINGVTANPDRALPGVGDADEAATGEAPGTNPLVPDQYLEDIRAAAAQADIVIPYFHMGVELQAAPPDWAVAVARAAIDAGATLVVISQPGVIGGMEVYQGRPIVYSLGNFVADQMFSVETRQGMILEVTLRGDHVVGLRVRGVEIEDFNQPRLMSGDEQAAFLDRFWRLTDALAGR